MHMFDEISVKFNAPYIDQNMLRNIIIEVSDWLRNRSDSD